MAKIIFKFERTSCVEVEANSVEEAKERFNKEIDFITGKMIEDGADFWDLCSVRENNEEE